MLFTRQDARPARSETQLKINDSADTHTPPLLVPQTPRPLLQRTYGDGDTASQRPRRTA